MGAENYRITPGLLGWRICCMNEWCSGPEMHKWWDVEKGEPPEWLPCPTCGWLAHREEAESMQRVGGAGR
jgi:hypothetical protein